MEGSIQKVLDTRGALRCVLFDSGNVGVVEERGNVILQFGRFRHIEFAEHDFVKLRCSKMELLQNPELRYMVRDEDSGCNHIFYADMKSGQMFGSMPELHRYGDFEVCFIRDCMFTRTRKCYSVDTHPSFVWPSKNGLYLTLPHHGAPEDDVLVKMLYRQSSYFKCLIKGDDVEVYWLEVRFKDDSVVVMDDEGVHFYVRLDKKTGKAVWRKLGRVGNAAERNMMNMTINDIEAEVRKRMLCDEEKTKKAAERQRKKEIKALVDVEPFQIGNKWGLKQGGRIVVPPIYRIIQSPVGKYCAVESYPGIWGVIAVDGKMEVEPKYEGVVIRPDGTVELTVFNGKTVIKKIKN